MRDIRNKRRFQSIGLFGLTHGQCHLFLRFLVTTNIYPHAIHVHGFSPVTHLHRLDNATAFQPTIPSRTMIIHPEHANKFPKIMTLDLFQTRTQLIPIIRVNMINQLINRVQSLLQGFILPETFPHSQHVLFNIVIP